MINQFSRTELILGKEKIQKLNNSKVAIFGLGGVGSFTTEALARAGIGKFVLIDNDVVTITNINRQLIALHSTINRPKVEIMKERILDINPNAVVDIHQVFYMPGETEYLIQPDYDYIVDAIDTVSAKLGIIETSKKAGIPIISSMGTGNKFDPKKFEITDISKTSVCPLAKVIRQELNKRNIKGVKVLYSKEEPATPSMSEEKSSKRVIPGSISFVPSVAGLMIAGEVIKDIVGGFNNGQ
jgi:tRNA A37 threonylcarbamoyladenosine dehydratase